MVWKVEVQPDAENDLSLIFDHLFKAYQGLGDDLETAFERARDRVISIKNSALDLGSKPHRGTMREEFGDGIRNITINQAVIWFQLDEKSETVRILAFFFGGQDHIRHMFTRLLSK